MAKKRNRRRASARKGNPPFRYVLVPVDTDADDEADIAFVVRVASRGSREAGIRLVAQAVSDDDRVNVVDARSFPTKHAALRKAAQTASRTEILGDA